MSIISNIRSLWSVFKDVSVFLADRAHLKKENLIKAHKEINNAFIATYNYLRNENGKYVANPELANLWNDASSAVMIVNSELGNILYAKSRFWLDPKLYIELNRESEIIDLKELVDEMERIRLRIIDLNI